MPNAKGVPLSRTGQLFTKRAPAYYTRDMYWVYEFMRRLSTPFKLWPAFKLGIIDAKGNVLIKVKDLTPQQQKAWSYLDEISVAIKRLIDRVPGIQPKLKTITGTMLLMKERREQNYFDSSESLDSLVERDFFQVLNTLQENAVAVNSAGAGNVAAIGVGPSGEPPKATALLKRKKLMKSLREFLELDEAKKPELHHLAAEHAGIHWNGEDAMSTYGDGRKYAKAEKRKEEIEHHVLKKHGPEKLQWQLT